MPESKQVTEFRSRQLKHPLHYRIGQILLKLEPPLRVLLDPACGGQQNLPLFYGADASNASELCNVDAIVLDDQGVHTIIEIEESNVKPLQICGKFLTTSFATHFVHNPTSQSIPLSKYRFLQILNGGNLPLNSSKKAQANIITSNIQKRCIPYFDPVSYEIIWSDDLTEKILLAHFGIEF